MTDVDTGTSHPPTLSPPARTPEPAQTSCVCCLRSHPYVCLQAIMHELIERDPNPTSAALNYIIINVRLNTPAPAVMCSCGNESGRLGLVGTASRS